MARSQKGTFFAKETHEFFFLTELYAASKTGDARALWNVIRKVENSNVAFLLTKEIEDAKYLLQSIERIQALKEAVLKMDRKIMVELRKYSKPPKIVHEVMKATLILLGHEITLVTVNKNSIFCLSIKIYLIATAHFIYYSTEMA